MTPPDEGLTLTFRCPQELYGHLPPPVPASRALPDWLREMPSEAMRLTIAGEDDTVKRCPPVLDAMTQGFLIPLVCDVTVRKGEFTWEWDLPSGSSLDYPRSPIGMHDPGQVVGTPLYDPDRFVVKFHNLWSIEAPAGYSLLFTHPLNRFDLPYTTLSGVVDCDAYTQAWIHFPATWQDESFDGVLPRGTPIAQCIPIRRGTWSTKTQPFSEDETHQARALMQDLARERGVYRRRFRA